MRPLCPGETATVTDQIRFDDGAAYERYMGKWSQLAGETFLDWLAPQSGLRWLDVGCGNGAFTEMLVERCAPVSVQGIDPSEGQLAYARTRPASRVAQFRQGDAMALPFPDDTFDAAVMPLVIFFVPDPAKGVAEMARVVCPGGTVTAYAWDMPGGGFPYEALQAEMRGLGVAVPACRRALTRLESTPCGTCGRLRVWMPSKRGRSPCNGHSPISTTTGRPSSGGRASVHSSQRWRPRISRFSKRGCARTCRQMPLAVSPIVRGLTR